MELANHLLDHFPKQSTVKEQAEHIWFRYIDWGVRHSQRFSLLQQLKLSNLISDRAQEASMTELSFASALIQKGIDGGLFKNISFELCSTIILAQLDAAVEFATTHDLRDMPLNQHISRTFEIFWFGVTA